MLLSNRALQGPWSQFKRERRWYLVDDGVAVWVAPIVVPEKNQLEVVAEPFLGRRGRAVKLFEVAQVEGGGAI